MDCRNFASVGLKIPLILSYPLILRGESRGLREKEKMEDDNLIVQCEKH